MSDIRQISLPDEPHESLVIGFVGRFLERDMRPFVRALEDSDAWPRDIVDKMKGSGLFGATIVPGY